MGKLFFKFLGVKSHGQDESIVTVFSTPSDGENTVIWNRERVNSDSTRANVPIDWSENVSLTDRFPFIISSENDKRRAHFAQVKYHSNSSDSIDQFTFPVKFHSKKFLGNF